MIATNDKSLNITYRTAYFANSSRVYKETTAKPNPPKVIIKLPY
jgi:hypothetical protein